MRLRSLPGAALEWTASAPGPGHAGLQFPHDLPLNTAFASQRGLSPPASREARCLPCIGRSSSGCSRISSSGSSTPSRSKPSVPGETNKVVLGGGLCCEKFQEDKMSREQFCLFGLSNHSEQLGDHCHLAAH